MTNVAITIAISAYMIVGALVYQFIEAVSDDPEFPIELTDKIQFVIVAALWPIEAVLIVIACIGKVMVEVLRTRNER